MNPIEEVLERTIEYLKITCVNSGNGCGCGNCTQREMLRQAIAAFRSEKYHIEKVPEGMKEPTLVDVERLNEGYIYRDCSQGCPLQCDGDIKTIIDSGECYRRQLAYLRREEKDSGTGN